MYGLIVKLTAVAGKRNEMIKLLTGAAVIAVAGLVAFPVVAGELSPQAMV